MEGDCWCEMWHENRHYFKVLLASGLTDNIKARLGEKAGNIKGHGLIALQKTKRRKIRGDNQASVEVEAFVFGA